MLVVDKDCVPGRQVAEMLCWIAWICNTCLKELAFWNCVLFHDYKKTKLRFRRFCFKSLADFISNLETSAVLSVPYSLPNVVHQYGSQGWTPKSLRYATVFDRLWCLTVFVLSNPNTCHHLLCKFDINSARHICSHLPVAQNILWGDLFLFKNWPVLFLLLYFVISDAFIA